MVEYDASWMSSFHYRFHVRSLSQFKIVRVFIFWVWYYKLMVFSCLNGCECTKSGGSLPSFGWSDCASSSKRDTLSEGPKSAWVGYVMQISRVSFHLIHTLDTESIIMQSPWSRVLQDMGNEKKKLGRWEQRIGFFVAIKRWKKKKGGGARSSKHKKCKKERYTKVPE